MSTNVLMDAILGKGFLTGKPIN